MNKGFKITGFALVLFLVAILSSCKGGDQKDPASETVSDSVTRVRQAEFEQKIEDLNRKELEIDSLRAILENKHSSLLEKEQMLGRRHSDLVSFESRLKTREMSSRIMMNAGYSLMLIGLILLLVSLVILRKLNKALYGSKKEEDPDDEYGEDEDEDTEDEDR